MTLEELAAQYQESARLLTQGLGELRGRLPHARGDEALELRRRMQVMAEELTDTARTARMLYDYYR